MDRDGSSELVVAEVRWEEKPGNGYLLRELFDLLLRRPDDLTDRDVPPTMVVEAVENKGGGER